MEYWTIWKKLHQLESLKYVLFSISKNLQPVKKLVQKAAIVKMKTVQQQQSKEVLLL